MKHITIRKGVINHGKESAHYPESNEKPPKFYKDREAWVYLRVTKSGWKEVTCWINGLNNSQTSGWTFLFSVGTEIGGLVRSWGKQILNLDDYQECRYTRTE